MNITLPLPPSLNAMYKTGRGKVYKSDEANEWIFVAGMKLKKQWRKIPLTGDVYLGIELFISRDRDIDNSNKALLDLLQGRVFVNDKQITHLNVKKYVDKENPRVEVWVEKL